MSYHLLVFLSLFQLNNMKKNLIKSYLRSLIKENIGYILFNVIIIILTVVFCLFNAPYLVDNQKKIRTLTSEVNLLNTRLIALNGLNITNDDLKKYLSFLNKLIPNSEDYFSLIYTLEKISQKTNFIINSYNVSLKQSSANKLKLTITGIGDRTTFMDFLKTYSFSGGRLVTSDKIQLDSQIMKEVKIDVTF